MICTSAGCACMKLMAALVVSEACCVRCPNLCTAFRGQLVIIDRMLSETAWAAMIISRSRSSSLSMCGVMSVRDALSVLDASSGASGASSGASGASSGASGASSGASGATSGASGATSGASGASPGPEISPSSFGNGFVGNEPCQESRFALDVADFECTFDVCTPV